MKTGLFGLLLAVVTAMTPGAPAAAAEIDDYYLAAFGETVAARSTTSLQKALLLSSPVEQQPHCGMPLKKGLVKDWNKLQASTQKVLAKQLSAPVLSGEQVYPTTHFRVHYATSGPDAPSPTVPYSMGSWAQKVADTFEEVYSAYTSTHNYTPPPNIPYDIYLRSLASQSIYGQTTSSSPAASPSFPYAYASYIEIDKDFTNTLYTKFPLKYTPLQSLQITAAHEFHHAIQYGYNFYFDIWYGEATSTWYEDELYDGVNQLYNYTSSWFSGNTTRSLDLTVDGGALTTGAGYSRWVFNRYLGERFASAVVADIWDSLIPKTPPGEQDIPMAPLIQSTLTGTPYSSSLGFEFFGLAKRAYVQDWSSHVTEISHFHPVTPVADYSSYPVNTSSTPAPSVTLPHYSFAYYRFVPSSSVTDLTITVSRSSGISAAVFKNTGGVISQIPANPGGTTFTVSEFWRLDPFSDEVMLLIANTSDVDGHGATFSTDGNSPPPPVAEPTGGSVYSGTGNNTSGSSGSSSSCFIATAAYGSYLHPQVAELRRFRDEHLLTNPVGREFVRIYYRYSPPVADVIARHDVLRAATRLALTPVVSAVVHPAASAGILLICIAICRPLRTRMRSCAIHTLFKKQ